MAVLGALAVRKPKPRVWFEVRPNGESRRFDTGEEKRWPDSTMMRSVDVFGEHGGE
jgi:hypothetical protein